MERAV